MAVASSARALASRVRSRSAMASMNSASSGSSGLFLPAHGALPLWPGTDVLHCRSSVCSQPRPCSLLACMRSPRPGTLHRDHMTQPPWLVLACTHEEPQLAASVPRGTPVIPEVYGADPVATHALPKRNLPPRSLRRVPAPVFIWRHMAWNASSLASLASRSTSASGLLGATAPSSTRPPRSAFTASSCVQHGPHARVCARAPPDVDLVESRQYRRSAW